MKIDVCRQIGRDAVFDTKRLNWQISIESYTFVHYFYSYNKQKIKNLYGTL
ncbi:hypothetical protein ZONE111905_11895 [Zobellia nedashkovskayae]